MPDQEASDGGQSPVARKRLPTGGCGVDLAEAMTVGFAPTGQVETDTGYEQQ
jgi:hypothetical protein